MKKLYILGAGASRELKFNATKNDISEADSKKFSYDLKGPLSSGFFYYTNEFLKAIKQFDHFGTEININNGWLENFIVDFYKKKNGIDVTMKEIIEDEQVSKKINIEEFYMAIEKEQAKIENGEGGEITEDIDIFLGEIALLNYIHQVFSTITYFCYSIYHRIFANYLMRTGGDVISFNWDILLEEEMYGTNKWNYCDGYGFSGAGIVDKNKLMRMKGHGYKKKCEFSDNIILKPHGSINWYKRRAVGKFDFVDNPESVFIGVPMTRSALRGGAPVALGRLNFCEIDRSTNTQYESLIVPPGQKRKRFNFIWDMILRKIEEADCIVAIGFSFNDFDKYIIEEISNVKIRKDVSIEVVNPDDAVVDKYKEIFKTDNVYKTHNNFSEYCKWITSQEDMKEYASLFKDE